MVLFKFSSLAQKEFVDSAEWYEEQTLGLGKIFADEIYQSIDTISRNPETYSKKRSNTREFVVDKFPFLIVYEFVKRDNVINVLHIFHTSRHPKHKYKK